LYIHRRPAHMASIGLLADQPQGERNEEPKGNKSYF
jgi:hypothetical protein